MLIASFGKFSSCFRDVSTFVPSGLARVQRFPGGRAWGFRRCVWDASSRSLGGSCRDGGPHSRRTGYRNYVFLHPPIPPIHHPSTYPLIHQPVIAHYYSSRTHIGFYPCWSMNSIIIMTFFIIIGVGCFRPTSLSLGTETLPRSGFALPLPRVCARL